MTISEHQKCARKWSSLPTKVVRSVHFETSETMSEVKNGAIQAVITSPPYWNLKNYGHPAQIGFGEPYERYLQRMDRVWAQCMKKLKPDGTMWIVVDKIWYHKEVVDIPHDIAKRCQLLGFLLQDMVVWNKPTAIAGLSPTNLVNKYETVLFLSKSTKFKLRLPLEEPRLSPDWTSEPALTDVWRFPVKAGSLRKTPVHEAPYPEELVARIIALSTDEGDTVLDPFLGAGTTMKVALRTRRRCIGYEINPAFVLAIAENLYGLPALFAGKTEKQLNAKKTRLRVNSNERSSESEAS